MGARIFWDVDTQVDFMCRDGKLYVADAELIEGNLERLTKFARSKGIRLLGSVDYHESTDPEISEHPDFRETFPAHCLRGSSGQEKVAATAPIDPLWIESESMDERTLVNRMMSHEGEVIFRKQRFDVFSNPNVDPIIEALDPIEVVVYGVALDVCNRYAIEGFLARQRKLTLVVDATKAIYPEEGGRLIRLWESRGVRIATTSDVVDES